MSMCLLCREWAQRELMFSEGLFHPGKEVQAGNLIMSGVGLSLCFAAVQD